MSAILLDPVTLSIGLAAVLAVGAAWCVGHATVGRPA